MAARTFVIKRRTISVSFALVVVAVGVAIVAGGAPSDGAENRRYVEPVFDAVAETPDLVYGTAVNAAGERQQLKLDLFEAAGDEIRARPLLVVAHGGAFRMGSRRDRNVRALAADLAKRGWVVASISYRLRPAGTVGAALADEPIMTGSTYRAMMRDAREDMRASVRWLRAHASDYRLDPDRIALAGNSAGGITALGTMFGENVSGVRAAVSLWGASDARLVRAGAGPILMFHGVDDTIVPYASAVRTCEAQLARGGVCEFVPYHGEAHGLWHDLDAIAERTARFLLRYVVARAST